jgi:hypothetical protein
MTGPTGCPRAKEQSKERQSWMSQLSSCDGWHRDLQILLLKEKHTRIWLPGCGIGRIHEISILKQIAQVRLAPEIWCGGL